MTTFSPPAADPPGSPDWLDEPLLDVRALARWLGVSEHTVRKWCAKGPDSGCIPTMIRLPGQIKFRPCDVREWIASREDR